MFEANVWALMMPWRKYRKKANERECLSKGRVEIARNRQKQEKNQLNQFVKSTFIEAHLIQIDQE